MNSTERFFLRDSLLAGKGVSNFETLLDYGVRVDDQPIYIGRALMSTSTAENTWTVEKITYDGSNRPITKQVRIGAWDDRATLLW